MLITEIPEWKDSPYREIIPARYTIRKNDNLFVISDETDSENIRHCDTNPNGLNEETVSVMILNLGGSIFESKHPDELPRMFQRMAEDKLLWDEYNKLTGKQ